MSPPLPLSVAEGRDRALGYSYCSILLCIPPAAPQSLGSSQKGPIESGSNYNVLQSLPGYFSCLTVGCEIEDFCGYTYFRVLSCLGFVLTVSSIEFHC